MSQTPTLADIELAIRSELHLPPVYSGDIRRAAKKIFRLISDDSEKTSDDKLTINVQGIGTVGSPLERMTNSSSLLAGSSPAPGPFISDDSTKPSDDYRMIRSEHE